MSQLITHISIALIFLTFGLLIGLSWRERRYYTAPRPTLARAYTVTTSRPTRRERSRLKRARREMGMSLTDRMGR